jgi:hypothetical protein
MSQHKHSIEFSTCYEYSFLTDNRKLLEQYTEYAVPFVGHLTLHQYTNWLIIKTVRDLYYHTAFTSGLQALSSLLF